MADKTDRRFDVHPSVVFQLGESLITDAVQALIELIKNCYDADASYAKVIIDTQGVVEVPDSKHRPDKGRIIVEDDGHGMSLDDIETGWLLISNRKKRDLKKAKKTTIGDRTPLGDKGLGRLGVQRLGDHLEIFTKSKTEFVGYYFGFSWSEFAKAHSLKEVYFDLNEIDYNAPKGTKVVITGLHEISIWRGQDAIKRLEEELSRMISPYKKIRDFEVLVEIDGKSLELLEITEKIRQIAPVRYELSFDGEKIKIDGKARLDFFRPSSPKEAEFFALIAESDDGKSFYEFLQRQKKSKTYGLSRSKSKHWFVEFHWKKRLDDLDKAERNELGSRLLANPGKFFGEVDSFDLGGSTAKQQSIFDRTSEYRRHIKQMSGIRVYRDGFAIRVDHDWLKLGAQWTSATSYYGLKPDNTLGYISLSARENIELEETTDREGFKDTPYYRNFYLLMMEFRDFTLKAHNFFGRSWSEFRKKRNEELASVDGRKSVEEISQTIKRGLAKASTHQDNLIAFRSRIEKGASDSKSVIDTLSNSKDIDPQLRKKLTATLSSLEPLLDESKTVMDQLTEYLEEISALKDMGQVVEDRVESLRRQMDDMYETIALGITAEALSHEVFNVADQLAKRAKSLQTRLKKNDGPDRNIIAFIECPASLGNGENLR